MKDYHSSHMVMFDPYTARGYMSIEVLPELIGKKWGEIALGYCHAVRPTCIRVVKGEEKTDACTWRLTVYVDADDIITGLRQEVEIGGFGEVRNGMAMHNWLALDNQ